MIQKFLSKFSFVLLLSLKMARLVKPLDAGWFQTVHCLQQPRISQQQTLLQRTLWQKMTKKRVKKIQILKTIFQSNFLIRFLSKSDQWLNRKNSQIILLSVRGEERFQRSNHFSQLKHFFGVVDNWQYIQIIQVIFSSSSVYSNWTMYL